MEIFLDHFEFYEKKKNLMLYLYVNANYYF